ncbi:MAG: transcription factor of the MADS box [Vezdaea aestivalis]|nr:MAG: transcription factor of the MADS box [Vezdaea aestivalis]
MGELSADKQSPQTVDDGLPSNGDVTESRGIKRPRPSAAVDDDEDDEDKQARERRKIEIKFITDKSRRHITFSKRKAGIMKKAYELSVLTGTQVLLLVVSETGLVYTFTTPKLQPLVTKPEGKNLIQACLNAPEPPPGNENGEQEPPVGSPEESNHTTIPRAGMAQPHQPMAPNYPIQSMTTEQQAIMQQQYYLQQQQQQQVQQAAQRSPYAMQAAGHQQPQA